MPNRRDPKPQHQQHHSPKSPHTSSLIQDQLPLISPRQPKSSKHQQMHVELKAPTSRLSANLRDSKAIKVGETAINRN